MTIRFIEPDWPLKEKIVALTTLRDGGVSDDLYSSLNLALNVEDNRADVITNRKMLIEELNLVDEPRWLIQTHSKIIVNASEIKPDKVSADASYTHEKNIVCSILTADCLPIVLADHAASCVGVVHAGWKGLLNGIIQESVRTMSEVSPPTYAWLGPAIGVNVFEVGLDVYQAYVDKDSNMIQVFKQVSAKKWLLDIYHAARIVLKSHGVTNIFGGGYCTFTDNERFFSYRREPITGRMATLAWLK